MTIIKRVSDTRVELASPAARKAAAAISRLVQLPEANELARRLAARVALLRRRQHVAACQAIWDAMAIARAAAGPNVQTLWRLTDGWVHHHALKLRTPYRVDTMHKGRKWHGVWLVPCPAVSAVVDGVPVRAEALGPRAWVPFDRLTDLRPHTAADDTPSARARDAMDRKAAAAIVGNLDAAIDTP